MITEESYLKKLIKGKISLSITFWLWFVFISLMINFFIDNSFNEVEFHRNNSEMFFSITIYFLIFIYSIFIFIAVQKSALNYIGNKLWSFLARVIITINLFFSLFQAYDLLRVYFFEDYAIKSEINNFKKSLPLKVDSFSYLINIDIKEKNIYYTYLLDNIEANSKLNINKFKSQVQDSLCEDENTLKLLKKDYVLDYTYVDKNEEKFTNIITNKLSCGKSIYDLEILREILRNEN
ncbi:MULTISPECIES: hypothetical protein [Arcobacteraceae]|uniref:Uncharacterized protein n=1 Tax=Poseidonibacter parvus TaxID=1850254 RepID=A0A1P8KLV6_9BACT|nr:MULTISPECIES: hypothetical protein [Arcobacteraceae]APW65512.1 hypothetical protein LPB137_06470 [Poseidonibacter parvus]